MCPVTDERLCSADLVTNVVARGVISSSSSGGASCSTSPVASNSHRCAVDMTATPFGTAAAGVVRLSAVFLMVRLSSGAPEEQKKMTYEARKFSKWNIFYPTCLVEVDARPWQLHLLSSTDASVQNNAMNVEARRPALVEAYGLGLIIDTMNVAAKVEARQNTVAVLFYLKTFGVPKCMILKSRGRLKNWFCRSRGKSNDRGS